MVVSASVMALMLAACSDSSTDEPLPQPEIPASEARIIVSGGGTGSDSRANEPSIYYGECRANTIRLWLYSFHTTMSDTYSYEKLTSILTDETDITNGTRDKWTTWSTDLRVNSTLWTYFALSALAFTDTDTGLFSTTTGNYGTLSLSLTGSGDSFTTPELFFGQLDMLRGSNPFEYHDDNGVMGSNYVTGGHTYTGSPASGKLYRIVSQLNVDIRDVPQGAIEKMEMVLSNIPTAMTLFGNHGEWYKVSPASAHTDGETIVATATDFSDGHARLSTYLLPSTEGRKLTLRVYPKGGGETKEYDISPKESHYLADTDDEARVYFSAAPDELKDGQRLMVYNATNSELFSYANVRVNISGSFDNVLTDAVEIGVTIEVCPHYERTHYFDIAQ